MELHKLTCLGLPDYVFPVMGSVAMSCHWPDEPACVLPDTSLVS